MAQPPVKIGTSGYSFADWMGVFYPPYTPRGKMLDYYVKQFPTVEINSTYYRIPHPAVMYNLSKKAPDGFDFMVKVPQAFTHRRTELETDIRTFAECLRPLSDANMLAGCLAQFPYSFKYSPQHLDYLMFCREAVAPHQLFVEFRHDGWSIPTVFERLKQEAVGYVSVDEPDLPGLLARDLITTTDTAYIRLHGRNAASWWQGGGDRYNYFYSEEELEEWRAKIEEIRNKVRRIYVFFNNCYDGKAARNALEFMQKIGVAR